MMCRVLGPIIVRIVMLACRRVPGNALSKNLALQLALTFMSAMMS